MISDFAVRNRMNYNILLLAGSLSSTSYTSVILNFFQKSPEISCLNIETTANAARRLEDSSFCSVKTLSKSKKLSY